VGCGGGPPPLWSAPRPPSGRTNPSLGGLAVLLGSRRLRADPAFRRRLLLRCLTSAPLRVSPSPRTPLVRSAVGTASPRFPHVGGAPAAPPPPPPSSLSLLGLATPQRGDDAGLGFRVSIAGRPRIDHDPASVVRWRHCSPALRPGMAGAPNCCCSYQFLVRFCLYSRCKYKANLLPILFPNLRGNLLLI